MFSKLTNSQNKAEKAKQRELEQALRHEKEAMAANSPAARIAREALGAARGVGPSAHRVLADHAGYVAQESLVARNIARMGVVASAPHNAAALSKFQGSTGTGGTTKELPKVAASVAVHVSESLDDSYKFTAGAALSSIESESAPGVINASAHDPAFLDAARGPGVTALRVLSRHAVPASDEAFSVSRGVASVSARTGAPGFAATPSAITDPITPRSLVADAAAAPRPETGPNLDRRSVIKERLDKAVRTVKKVWSPRTENNN